MKHTVIIGNGVSGITCARHLRKLSNQRITVISAESDHFFSRTALMYVFMGHMKYENIKPYEDWFWEKNRIELLRAYVKRIDSANKQLELDNGQTFAYDQLVIASGSHPFMADWPGKHFSAIQGLVSLQDLEDLEINAQHIKNAVVVGGGLIGIEMVEMLRSRGIAVTYLIREFKFWNRVLPLEESEMIEKHILYDHQVDLRLGTEVVEIKGNENGRVSSVITNTGQEFPCDLLGVAIGVRPTIAFLKDSGIEVNRGVLVNQFMETNVPDVYAIGDCAEFREQIPGRLKIEQIWYTGRMHGECLAHTLAGKRTKYVPVNFFNSSKLMDIEFQVYSREVHISEHCEELFWKNDEDSKSIRLFFHGDSLKFEGVTLLGVRYRHEVCDRWLREERSIEYVLEHLADANFDPEFFKHYESHLVEDYNSRFNKSLKLKKRSWKRIFGQV